jgi:transcriptional regulator with XRE-family HTH domain
MSTTGFPARLGRELGKAGFTQSELGKLLGVSRSYVSHLVNGVREPKDQTVKLLAHILGVREAWLRDGKGQRKAGEAMRLSGDELGMLRTWRGLAVEGRLGALELLKAWAELDKGQRDTALRIVRVLGAPPIDLAAGE